jgi:hydroxymethylglutaryl-CoA lyase
MKCKTDEWNLMLSASDSHSKANANKTTLEALAKMSDIVAMAKDAGVTVTGSMSVALGCPFEGTLPIERLYMIVEEYLKIGVTSVGISDTAGMADPRLTYNYVKELIDRYPEVSYKLHFHNTRGMGLANIIAPCRRRHDF